MADVRIPISADFNSGDLDKVVQQFSSQMNRLAKSIAEANNTKFNPIDDATADDIKKVIHQFDALKRLSESFNKRLKDTGQSNAGLFDIDFHRLYENQRAGARKALDVLQYVTAGTTFASRMPGTTTGNQGGSQLPVPTNGTPATAGWKHWGGNVFNSAMGAAGPGGQVISNAVSAGMSGGLKAGLFGLAGGFAALGVGKLISSAREKIGDAQQEAIGYDRLKRSLGDINVGFDELKSSLRFSAGEIWETFGKTQELAVEFAKISGLSRDQSKNLAKEVAFGGGFSWSLGLDTKQGNQFFAQMRQFKVTNNESDTRRLGLMIGEGIARSGAFSKADELMQAIAGYTANQARMSLTVPNVAGYAGMLSSMVGSGIPGLDPQGAAAILGRANSAIMQGGGAGEAGQNFLHSILGRLGLNPVESTLFQEGGLLSTGASTFGGKLFTDWAKMRGVAAPGIAGNSSDTLFSHVMGGLGDNYSNPWLRLNAMSRMFGVNHSQAMALDVLHKQNPKMLGGMETHLSGLGVDISKLSSTGIMSTASIFTGDRKTLDGAARDLLNRTDKGKLNDQEREDLIKAQMGDDEGAFRDVLMKLTSTREMQQTEGSKTQELLSETNRVLQDMASRLVPAIDTMKDGILHLARLAGFKPIQSFDGEIYKELNAAGNKLDKINGISTAATAGQLPDAIPAPSPATSSEVNMSHDAKQRMESVLASLPPGLAQRIRDKPTFQKQVAVESGWRHLGKDGKLLRSKAGALGITQVMPETGKNPGGNVIPLRDDSMEEYLRFGLDYDDWLHKEFGGDTEKALAAYNWGVGNVKKFGDRYKNIPETNNYVNSIMKGLPEGHDKRFADQSQETKLSLHVTGTMNDHSGRPLGPIEAPVTRIKLPSANGM
ncbi:lytic transglycosylase domain-containing protein [Nitrosomonas sp. Nm132]|uniref:lytic transglycosylase domain-containing protein n=1 Tax=Nitrosomonas sp. Nm132 TaxID=1881053 RepID=UPI000884673E|nr:lytic transglycosylase domain-containing protein [Nitrosomonas sp. Nm132]SDH27435.1 Transglycosylase SLT domain-containing protein [Nitrosomonas sp. Nm132]